MLACHPKHVTRVWGGRALFEVLGQRPTLNGPVGESWEVADLPEGCSVVSAREEEAVTLDALRRAWGRALTGRADDDAPFPLLVKHLDACDDLSVQVHPGPEHVGALPRARAKDEAWVILDAAPGACVLHGLRDPTITPADLRAAIETGRAVETLRRVEVQPGDVLHVPPGTLHAICAGVLLLEIQQPSDTTYRVYDYDRPGLDGAPRPLHLEEAMQVTRFGPQPPERLSGHAHPSEPWREVFLDAGPYTLERWHLDTARALPCDGAPWVICVETGAITIHDHHGALTRARGEVTLAPAARGAVTLSPHDAQARVIVTRANP